jgi:hypothetical protein
LSDGEETKGAGKYTYAAGNDFWTGLLYGEKKNDREKKKEKSRWQDTMGCSSLMPRVMVIQRLLERCCLRQTRSL